MTRTQERAATAVAALLLQLFFILLFTHFLLTPQAQKERAREMLLLLRPSRQPQPALPPVRQTPSRTLANPEIVLPPLPAPGITGVTPTAPSLLEAIGRALSGCTAEGMAKLSPEDRAKCPPLGIIPPRPDQDLVEQPRSHAKDEALWAEERAERDWMPDCSGAAEVGKCLLLQARQEHDRVRAARSRIDEERRRRAQPPLAPIPKWFGSTPPAAH